MVGSLLTFANIGQFLVVVQHVVLYCFLYMLVLSVIVLKNVTSVYFSLRWNDIFAAFCLLVLFISNDSVVAELLLFIIFSKNLLK